MCVLNVCDHMCKHGCGDCINVNANRVIFQKGHGLTGRHTYIQTDMGIQDTNVSKRGT